MAKNDVYYKTIVRILSYSDVSPSSQICVYNSTQIAQNFQNYLTQNKSQYSAVAVNANNFKTSSCQVVYFANLTQQEENRLIRSYPKQKVLTISDNNPQCELGSAVCLTTRPDKMIVDINMDSLARSQVKISSQVLQMFKK